MTSSPTPSRTTTIRPRRGEIWLINLDPTIGAELQKTRPAVVMSAAADVLQMRSIALERFVKRQGRMPAPLMDEIAAAIAAVVEYQ